MCAIALEVCFVGLAIEDPGSFWGRIGVKMTWFETIQARQGVRNLVEMPPHQLPEIKAITPRSIILVF